MKFSWNATLGVNRDIWPKIKVPRIKFYHNIKPKTKVPGKIKSACQQRCNAATYSAPLPIMAQNSFQTKFWTADSSFQIKSVLLTAVFRPSSGPLTAVFRRMGSYLVFKLSLWGQFSQKQGMSGIEWPIPLKRAGSELSYRPACQKGFTSPLKPHVLRDNIFVWTFNIFCLTLPGKSAM